MKRVLYIPGFQEPHHSKQPGKIIEEYCRKNQIAYTRMMYPGDTSWIKWESGEFSISSLTAKIYDTLIKIQDKICVATYSLGTRSTIDAISSLSDEVRTKISLLTFIHPAVNPLYAVRIRDWIFNSEEFPYADTHYLEGCASQVFNSLIWDWKWDWEQFQFDLQRYANNTTPLQWLTKDLGIPCLEISSPNDRVIHPGELWKKSRVLLSHIPKLNDRDIDKMLK